MYTVFSYDCYKKEVTSCVFSAVCAHEVWTHVRAGLIFVPFDTFTAWLNDSGYTGILFTFLQTLFSFLSVLVFHCTDKSSIIRANISKISIRNTLRNFFRLLNVGLEARCSAYEPFASTAWLYITERVRSKKKNNKQPSNPNWSE